MLVDTDTEQDELTAELPTAAKTERKRKTKSRPASASDPDTFEMAVGRLG